MSANIWQATKVGKKIAVWSSYVFNIFFWHCIRFPRFNPNSATIIFNVFWNIPKEKYFVPLRVLTLLIKSYANFHFFLDVALTFFDNLFSSFLFKSIFFTKLAILFLLAKFACFNPVARFSDVKLLSSNIFIKIMIRSNFIFNFTYFCIMVSFFDYITNIRCFISKSSKSSSSG